MRAVHSDPKKWAELAKDRSALETEIRGLIDRGLFYLRYTTGDPAVNMRGKGVRIVADYIERYAAEFVRWTLSLKRISRRSSNMKMETVAPLSQAQLI